MQALRDMRSEVPLDPPSREAEARLVAALRDEPARPRRRLRGVAWGAGLATGLAAAVAVGLVLAQGGGGGPVTPRPGDNGVAAAPLKLTSAAQVLDLAASAKGQPELIPRPDQAIMIKSTTMYIAESRDYRYLYRTDRAVWWPAAPNRDGAIEITSLEPKSFPGEPLPPVARQGIGETSRHVAKYCPGRPEFSRTDFAYVSGLPTTPEAMLAYLRTAAGGENTKKGGKRTLDEMAFTAAGDLIRERYLPPAQRAAVYRALGSLSDLRLIEGAEDAAGRKGVAVAYDDATTGVRRELVFDPSTFLYLGERAFVTDADKAGTAVGTQVASTALLSAEVVDTVPAVELGPKGGETCG
ncbi:CU044_5270 family protein [Virgisporangium ochraceum]|nr:CU044_5270 family protein [Virgisporangium ochraceum]